MSDPIVITSVARTPIGAMQGQFSSLSGHELGSVAVKAAVARGGVKPEDVDEVMRIIKKNGGMEKIHLAFYPDAKMKDDEPWHFWRLEGPGFVWNYRPLPHVHTYVNISSKLT